MLQRGLYIYSENLSLAKVTWYLFISIIYILYLYLAYFRFKFITVFLVYKLFVRDKSNSITKHLLCYFFLNSKKYLACEINVLRNRISSVWWWLYRGEFIIALIAYSLLWLGLYFIIFALFIIYYSIRRWCCFLF